MRLKFELFAIAESAWRADQIDRNERGECLKEDGVPLGAFVEVSDRWNTSESMRSESRLGDLEVPTKVSESKAARREVLKGDRDEIGLIKKKQPKWKRNELNHAVSDLLLAFAVVIRWFLGILNSVEGPKKIK